MRNLGPWSMLDQSNMDVLKGSAYIDNLMVVLLNQSSPGHAGPSSTRNGVSKLSQDTPLIDLEIPGKMSYSSD